MAYISKSNYSSRVSTDFVQGSNKWTGAEVKQNFTDIGDSVMWIDQKITMPALDFNCASSSLQEKTLAVNSALTISNAVPGAYYTLIKNGAYTLSLPSTNFSANGATVPSGKYVVTFLYDGSKFFFNFAEYTEIA